MAETRMDFGWKLVKAAWRLSRRDRVLLGLGFPAALLLGGAGIANLALTSPERQPPLLLLALLLLGCALAGVLFQAALAFAADAALDGERLSWREALAEARWRLGALLGWAVIAAAVAVVLAILVHVRRLGFAAALISAGWSFATVFVVPMLAIDLASPGEALREIPYLVGRRWGEMLTGAFGIGAIAALAAVPGAILVGAGTSHNHSDPGSGTLPILLGAVLIAAVGGFATTAFQTFAVGLYRDATLGLPGDPAFVERRPKRRSWVVRIAAVALVLLVSLGLIGSIVGPRPRAHEFHTRFPARYSVAISAGMPVVYEGAAIGEVKRTEISDGEDVVWFTVEPDYRSLQDSTSISLSYFDGRPCLIVLAPGQSPPGSASEPFGGPA